MTFDQWWEQYPHLSGADRDLAVEAWSAAWGSAADRIVAERARYAPLVEACEDLKNIHAQIFYPQGDAAVRAVQDALKDLKDA